VIDAATLSGARLETQPVDACRYTHMASHRIRFAAHGSDSQMAGCRPARRAPAPAPNSPVSGWKVRAVGLRVPVAYVVWFEPSSSNRWIDAFGAGSTPRLPDEPTATNDGDRRALVHVRIPFAGDDRTETAERKNAVKQTRR
jgi:hypothetical protein